LTLQQSTTEYESFREDAVAVINGAAVSVAVMAFWTRPAYMAIIALLVAVVGYFLNPRSRGGTILAVFIISMIALLFTAQQGYSLV
jgi:membrane protein YdbS with pleckstrin-like domain